LPRASFWETRNPVNKKIKDPGSSPAVAGSTGMTRPAKPAVPSSKMMVFYFQIKIENYSITG